MDLFEEVEECDESEMRKAWEVFINYHNFFEEYVDSERITRVKSQEDYKRHDAKATCCGYADEHYSCRSGNEYMMGCNYGH